MLLKHMVKDIFLELRILCAHKSASGGNRHNYPRGTSLSQCAYELASFHCGRTESWTNKKGWAPYYSLTGMITFREKRGTTTAL